MNNCKYFRRCGKRNGDIICPICNKRLKKEPDEVKQKQDNPDSPK